MAIGPKAPAVRHLWRRLSLKVSRLIAYGTGGFPPVVRRRLQILNVFAYLTAIFTLAYTAQQTFVDYQTFAPVIWINLAIAIGVLLVPLMHRFGEIAGGMLMAAVELVGLFVLTFYLGSRSGVHIQYIVGASAPFFIFGLERIRLIVPLILLCFAMHVMAWLLFPEPHPAFAANAQFINAIYFSAAAATFAMTAALVHYAFRLAERAQAATDDLLRNILPESVAERLKAAPGTTIADSFASASVLFADLKGFVPIAQSLGPARTVELLNRLMHELDALAQRHGVEKIKTIGDAYMVAAGIPSPVPDHALRLTRMGLDMVQAARRLSGDLGVALEMRIGIASGPVLAGVIGAKRLTYDVWGDTVNLAARLESQGVPGRVQVSSATRDLLGGEIACEPRGAIDVRGLGALDAWLVVEAAGTRPEA